MGTPKNIQFAANHRLTKACQELQLLHSMLPFSGKKSLEILADLQDRNDEIFGQNVA